MTRIAIVNPRKVWVKTYHVNDDPASGSGLEAGGNGKLSDLRLWLELIDLESLEPSIQTPSAILSVMSATPAVLQSLVASVSDLNWPHKPTADEWALVEVICHLRDTEREIHRMQVNTLLEESEPFIPRPDSTVWAKERNYLKEDGRMALQEFASARLEMLARSKGLDDAVWKQKARHAIFGPTHFQEVIGFMADHDRMHIQQAWNILKTF